MKRHINFKQIPSIMKSKAGMAAFAACLGLYMAPACIHNVQPMRPPPVISIEHRIDKEKEKVALKCDAARIETRGYNFYACEEDLAQELLMQMEYIANVKAFGEDVLNFKPTKNYLIYKNRKTEMPKTRYRLYVTGETELPRKHDKYYVYVAERSMVYQRLAQPTIFISTKDNLEDEERFYKRKGYDTNRRVITSFGGDCDLDPEFLSQPLASQTGVVIHEDFHGTAANETEIEESLAVMMEMAGATEFTEKQFGPESSEHEKAKANLRHWLDYSLEISRLNKELTSIYAKGITLEEKLKEKEKILSSSEYGWNNAKLWAGIPYTINFPLAYEVYTKHKDTKELAKIFLECPKNEEEAIEYLKRFSK